MPITDRTGESKPESAWPGQEFSCCSAGGPGAAGALAAASVILLGEAVPAADPVQAQQGQREQPGDDHEELQHLVVDRGREPAEGDVGEHDRRRRRSSATHSDQPSSARTMVPSR